MYRSGVRGFDRSSRVNNARLFYYKLGDCKPLVEGTASSTPLHYGSFVLKKEYNRIQLENGHLSVNIFFFHCRNSNWLRYAFTS